MVDQVPARAWGLAAALVVVLSTPVWAWGPRAVASVVIGGMWNLASLWCLTRLLSAWISPRPSRRRAVGWLLVKAALLTGLVVGLLRVPWLSAGWFGLGFTLALLVVVGALAPRARRVVEGGAHGR